jgi:hypothetical protein
LRDYKTERGKPEASIQAEIELHLENYKISRASYHGGDDNGVCCRRLVEHAKPKEVRTVLITKKDERCENKIVHNKVDDLEQMLGLPDAAFTYLNIFILMKKKSKRLGRQLLHYPFFDRKQNLM